MSKIIRLTENDLNRIVRKVIKESETNEQGLVGKIINKFIPKAAKAAPLGVVSNVSKQMSSFFSDILPKLPATLKMPVNSLQGVKNNVIRIEGNVSRLSNAGGGSIKGPFISLFSSIDNVATEMKKAAGTQFDIKKVINELYRGKSEAERILKTPQITKTMGQGNVKSLETTLMDINKSIGDIEIVLTKAIKK
jgi:hypothetical protein